MMQSTRRYRAYRDITPAFLATAKSWLTETGELLAIFRFLAAGGAKVYGLYETFDAFIDACTIAPIGTDIIIFKDRQLPLRGTVDPAFQQQAMELIPATVLYLLVDLEPPEYKQMAFTGYWDQGHDHLVEDLESLTGHRVAAGVAPDFMGPDNDRMISAAKGGIDGPR